MGTIRKISCIVCASQAFHIKLVAGRWDIFKCGKCGLEFCSPMPTPEDLNRFYTNYSDPRAGQDVILANAHRNIKTLSDFGLTTTSRVLDFGSGQGAFVQAGNSPSWVNFDPYKEGANDETILKSETYDWITLWGVLEHLTDPVAQTEKLSAILMPDGYLALTTVTTEGSIPYQHKPPEHVSYWTRRALELLLNDSGLTICKYAPYAMAQDCDVYLNSVLRTVPESLKPHIHHTLPKMVEVPTNEVFVICRRMRQKS
ncbi:MAG: class I SAM-dependent methyltransferase [Phycisphaerae bacterium]